MIHFQVIYGYAMAINLIADYMLQNKIPSIEGLKGITCTSEVLTDKMRDNIEKAFKNDKAIKQFQVIFDETSVYINLMVDEGFDNKQHYLNLIKKNFYL